MNDSPSNSPEMDPLKALEHIKKVEVRASLYDDITTLVNSTKVISMAKLRAAAAVLLCLISIEVYVLSQSSETDTTEYSETLVPLTFNSIYYE